MVVKPLTKSFLTTRSKRALQIPFSICSSGKNAYGKFEILPPHLRKFLNSPLNGLHYRIMSAGFWTAIVLANRLEGCLPCWFVGQWSCKAPWEAKYFLSWGPRSRSRRNHQEERVNGWSFPLEKSYSFRDSLDSFPRRFPSRNCRYTGLPPMLQ